MKVNYIKASTMAIKANNLLKDVGYYQSYSIKIDIINIATQHLGLSLYFVDLQASYGKGTLGQLLTHEKIILCDISLEPKGYRKQTNEHMLRFTIAHEVAHYILHKKYSRYKHDFFLKNFSARERDKLETQADMMAAMLLMPKDIFTKEYNKLSTLYTKHEIIKKLSNIFNVSKKSTQHRITNLKL
jgi:hypothetical protein